MFVYASDDPLHAPYKRLCQPLLGPLGSLSDVTDDRATQPPDLSQEVRSHEYIQATRRNDGGWRACQRRRAGRHLQRGRGVRLDEHRGIDVTVHRSDDAIHHTDVEHPHAHDSQPVDPGSGGENGAAERSIAGQTLPEYGLWFERKLRFQRKLGLRPGIGV